MAYFTSKPARWTARGLGLGFAFTMATTAMAFTAGLSAKAFAAPKVVASIKPVHSIVATVMEGVATPELIISGSGSPHTYTLRPSQARALSQADLVVWVGPQLETFLKKPVETLVSKALVLSDAKAINRLPFREIETAGDGDDHDHDHHDHEGAFDPHIWLSIDNGIAIAETVAAELAKLDPTHADTYTANAQKFSNRMKIAKIRLKASLVASKPENYVVFHNAYGYFENDHKMRPAGVITVNPEIAPGAKRIAELRKLLREKSVACVFSEPQYNAAIASALVSGTDIKVRVLDPLGATLQDGPTLYPALVSAVAQSFKDCVDATS
ncbi:MAG: zinc ABC transporter substrate-binding protein [Pseudomonadota bacterium]